MLFPKVTIIITNLFVRSWDKATLNVISLNLWIDARLNTHLISRVCTCFYISFIFIKLFNFLKMTSLTFWVLLCFYHDVCFVWFAIEHLGKCRIPLLCFILVLFLYFCVEDKWLAHTCLWINECGILPHCSLDAIASCIVIKALQINWYISSRWSDGTRRPFKFSGAYLGLFRRGGGGRGLTLRVLTILSCRHLLRVLVKVTFIWIRYRYSTTMNFRIYQFFSIFAGWEEVARATQDPS